MHESTSFQESTYREKDFSLFNTFLWMIFLALGIQTILGLVMAIGFQVSGISDDDMALVFERPDVLAITGVIAALISFPLIKKAAHQADKLKVLEFLSIHSINKTTLVKVLLLGIGYYIFELIVIYALSIDTPQFMLDIKAQANSSFDIVMLLLAICIVAPIIEEVIFRGLAYARLVQSRAGVRGAIIITSVVFTAIHLQYELIVLAVLLGFAFFIGCVRYKTGNLIYCIILHMQFNMFSMIYLFFYV